jgi:pyrrolidone-carboxylate peptidase
VSDTIELAKDDLPGTATQNTGVYVCTELVWTHHYYYYYYYFYLESSDS